MGMEPDAGNRGKKKGEKKEMFLRGLMGGCVCRERKRRRGDGRREERDMVDLGRGEDGRDGGCHVQPTRESIRYDDKGVRGKDGGLAVCQKERLGRENGGERKKEERKKEKEKIVDSRVRCGTHSQQNRDVKKERRIY